MNTQHSLTFVSRPAGDRKRLRLATYEWRPELRVRALVVLAHGYGEHANRHGRPITALLRRGYAVVALDHRGHGRSEGPRATCDRFDDYTDDFAALVSDVSRRYGRDTPLFALGHSMGALIALRYALRAAEEREPLAGLVLAGVALHPVPAITGPLRPVIKRLVRLVARVTPGLPVTPPCESRCRPNGDLLCYSGPTPARMADQLLRAGDDASKRLEDLACPLLVLHGMRDRVTGPEGSLELHARAGSPDKTLSLFPRLKHPVLTPTGSPALPQVLDWLDARRDATATAPADRLVASDIVSLEAA